MRDRAADLLAEEDDLARTLASTWARDPDKSFPRLHADPDRLLGRATRRVLVDRLDARVARHPARRGVRAGARSPATAAASPTG